MVSGWWHIPLLGALQIIAYGGLVSRPILLKGIAHTSSQMTHTRKWNRGSVTEPYTHIQNLKHKEMHWPIYFHKISSVAQSCLNFDPMVKMWPHGLQHARLPCPSPTPGACSNSCPSSRWCHPTISSSVVPFSYLQSFPASGSFPRSQFFSSGGQSIGASASTSVLPMKDEMGDSARGLELSLLSEACTSGNVLSFRWELTHWKRLWCWEGLGTGGEGDDKGWDGWMASPTRWTWVWVNSGSWWWTGRPGVQQFMGLQRVGHDWETELNWLGIKIFLHNKTQFPPCSDQ